jgi:glycosyl transferase, family 25
MKPIFVINLDRRKDRLDSISKTLADLGLKWRRISAVDGRNAEIHNTVDRNKSRIYNEFREPLPGAVACYLSHQSIWRIMVQEHIPEAMILEDDVTATDSWSADILGINIHGLGIDQLRLSANYVHGAMPKEPYRQVRILQGVAQNLVSAGAGAQILTLDGARKCLSISKIWFPVDDFLMFNRILGLRTLLLTPPMWEHDINTASDTTPPGYYDGPDSLLRKIARIGSTTLREYQRFRTPHI